MWSGADPWSAAVVAGVVVEPPCCVPEFCVSVTEVAAGATTDGGALLSCGGRGGVTVFEGFFAFSVLELFVAFVLAVDFGAAAALDFVLVPPALYLAIELDFNLAASEVEDFLVAEAFRFVDCETPVRSGAPAAAERAPRSSGAEALFANTAPPGSESPTKDATNIPNFTGP